MNFPSSRQICIQQTRIPRRNIFRLLAIPCLTVPGLTVLGCTVLACAVSTIAVAQSSKPVLSPVISLDPAEVREVQSEAAAKPGSTTSQPPANFRNFADAKVGEPADLEKLTLRFAETTKLTKIASTPDFQVEQGSSCVEGDIYQAKTTCTLLVRFTPQGAGHRVGKLTIDHTASITPFYVGLGGNGYAPVISFTPAMISTVAGTYPSNKGLLLGAQNLATDGGDTLYIADTGNNVIRSIDSSGTITTVSSGSLSAPVGIAVDTFGEVFFSEPAAAKVFEIYDYGLQFQLSGTGTDSCTVASPCNIGAELLYSPGQMSIDANNQLFFTDGAAGAALASVQTSPVTLARLYDPFTYQAIGNDAFAVDAEDNLYSSWSITSVCQINSQSYSDAANSRPTYKKIAGGKTCGFSGDGGQARNAEIGSAVGQFAFDIAGNMYFTDTKNNRVRTIDSATGIISTIAGTGTAGNSGDGGAGTLSAINAPTGVAVDSQGQVYIISNSASTGTAQSIRKLGPNGALPFGNQLRGSASVAKTITLSNTGNSQLTFTKVLISGTNAGDFTLDPNTTSCNITANGVLANGQSCKVGVIFKPAAAGTRTANIVFLDNTVTNSNTVSLSGTGTLPSPTFAITAPASGASFTSGTTVKFSVSVTSTGTAPTGTVKFSVDGAVFGNPVALASGVASANLTGLTIKAHTLSASYSGDGNYSVAGPLTRTITVVAAAKTPATVKLGSKTSNVTSCTSIALSIAVTGKTPSSAPAGIVQLKDGSKSLANVTLNQGSALFTIPALSAGTHMLTASYEGDATHAAAVSPTLKEVVAPRTLCQTLIASPARAIRNPRVN
ncbi:Ig-like domain repeat protein [Acidicapsa ligni]|uniref:Ig-like domain repeat protein n=1 Tax=Acidicapsa ligni TaxID=542300 RepID=UPI0021E08502|nr:Ig-like domain repeat protein [Acidicapsa ligni]